MSLNPGEGKVPSSYGSLEPRAVGVNFDRLQALPEPNLGFHDISYTITAGLCGLQKGKVILNSISGVMCPGLNAIMGPTGSGKTTLLDILANRKASSRVSGDVLFNSEHIRPNFRFKTGYVVQEDVVTGSLTVRENLSFSAALRLPSNTTSAQRKERVEKVISELNLRGCADQKIGTEFIRGVSGGERKRTNIGMELIIQPQILFLDEPTTGLDAHTAVSVVHLMKSLTEGGERIVVMSIHQPRYSIVKLFDTLTLLSLGKLVYHGQASSALSYFDQLGFSCEEHENPGDFFLDVIDTCEEKEALPAASNTSSSSQPLVNSTNCYSSIREGKRVDLSESFLHSSLHAEARQALQPMLNAGTGVQVGAEAGRSVFSSIFSLSPYATSALWQFLMIVHRSSLKMWRNPMTNVVQLFVMIIFGLITGGIYYQRPETPRGMQDRLGAFFFITMSLVFGGLGAIELFIKEKMSFLHETSSGYYRVSVFFIAKVITDLLILRTAPLIGFATITYFLIGFQTDVAKFFIFFLTLALTTVAGSAIAFTFSAMVNVFAVANLLVSLVFVFYMLFGGALIGLSSLPSWIRWMKYISLFRYSVEALAVNELKGQMYYAEFVPNKTDPQFCADRITNSTSNITYCVANGTSFLDFYGYKVDWPWYGDQVALFITGVLWLSLTYTILRLAKKYYQHYK